MHTKLLKAYVGTVVPGFLQTPGYATALLSAIRDFHGTPNGAADAVAARMQRKRLVRSGTHRYAAVLEEAVLRQLIGDARRSRPGGSATSWRRRPSLRCRLG